MELIDDSLRSDLVVVDVGCRWGFADLFLEKLEKFRLYGFDPDRDECKRLESLYESERITLVPLGLSDHEGKETIHLTKEAACSSLYEPDKFLTENYPDLDCARKVGEAEIAVTTLDSWAERNDVGAIDFIKLDTQGSELPILNGAENVLKEVRALEVEVEFNPIYQGQPLFSDIDVFLRQRGFVLWRFTNFVHYGLDGENKIELGEDRIHYGENSQEFSKFGGQLYWADAHYVRAEIAQGKFTTELQLSRDIELLHSIKHIDLSDRLRKVLSSKL